MNLNDTKIVVAIENAVCDQLEASGIKADPFRLDGEKIVQVIIEQLGDYVVVPKELTEATKQKMTRVFHESDKFLNCNNMYSAMIAAAQEPTND